MVDDGYGPASSPEEEASRAAAHAWNSKDKGLVDVRIANMMEAWDFGQFADVNLEPGMKAVLYNGLQAVQDMVHSNKGLPPVVFNYDLAAAPKGTLQLLTAGMTRRTGDISSVASAKAQGVIAWAPVAERDRSEEIRLGHISPPRR